MAGYIECDVALDIIEKMQRPLCPAGRFGRSFTYGRDRETFDTLEEVADAIEAIPVADVAVVVHGRWKRNHQCQLYCSRCSEYPELAIEKPYCSNCGAKMDKEEI